jgi:hypothetical protein
MSLIIAVSLELAQGGIAGRYPDITDILGALAGASFGLWCCLRGWPAFKRIIIVPKPDKQG